MKKAEFNRFMKALLQDIKAGYYGQVEFIDEVWDHFNHLQIENRILSKMVTKLKKKS